MQEGILESERCNVTQIFETREEWLQAAVDAQRDVFKERTGLAIPDVRAGIGYMSKGMRSKAVGETLRPDAVADGRSEITIRIDQSDPETVLAILGHEIIHAVMNATGGDTRNPAKPSKDGHGVRFREAFTRYGYSGDAKMCEPGDALRAEYAALAKSLGNYPAAPITLADARKKKQTTRMLAFHCDKEEGGCGYAVSTTRVHAERAMPVCPDPRCPKFMESMLPKTRKCNENGEEE